MEDIKLSIILATIFLIILLVMSILFYVYKLIGFMVFSTCSAFAVLAISGGISMIFHPATNL